MLITEDYRKAQEQMHEEPRYGAACLKFIQPINKLVSERRPATILDYGAGKRLLRTALQAFEAKLTEYDPGIPEIASVPLGLFDIVVCIDVLEHVEPECLSDVLADIRALTGEVAFLTVHTGPAGKFLPDGRNAHLIQQPFYWWLQRLQPLYRSLQWDKHGQFTYSIVCEV